MSYFLDSSAVVKRYVVESGSQWIRNLFSTNDDLYIARITGAEVVSAIMRRARRGDISFVSAANATTKFRQDFRMLFDFVDATDQVIDRAMSYCEQHALRGYDAVQLASALAVQRERSLLSLPPVTFISADLDLLAAATAEGMTTDDPNRH